MASDEPPTSDADKSAAQASGIAQTGVPTRRKARKKPPDEAREVERLTKRLGDLDELLQVFQGAVDSLRADKDDPRAPKDDDAVDLKPSDLERKLQRFSTTYKEARINRQTLQQHEARAFNAQLQEVIAYATRDSIDREALEIARAQMAAGASGRDILRALLETDTPADTTS